jgi:Transposase IS116/IS110/IS902 family
VTARECVRSRMEAAAVLASVYGRCCAKLGRRLARQAAKTFPARVREPAADDPVLMSLESLLSVIEVTTRELGRLTKRALDEVRIEPTCRRLMTVPGVGPLTALAFRATIDQPGRFRKAVGAAAARFDSDAGLAASFAVGSPRLFFTAAMRSTTLVRCGSTGSLGRCLRPSAWRRSSPVASSRRILDVGIAKLTAAGA